MRKISFSLLAFTLILSFFSCEPGTNSPDENNNGGNNSGETGDYSSLEGAWEYIPEESSNDLFYKAYFESDNTLYIYGRDINDILYLEKKMSISDVTTDAFLYSSLLEEGSCSYTIENDKLVLVWDNDANERYTLGKITESVPLGIKYYLMSEDNPSLSADIEARNWWTQAGYSFFVLPTSLNLNGLKPVVETTNGATVTPGSLVAQDLSSPVNYSYSKDGVNKTQTLVAFQPSEDTNMLINGDFTYGSLFWDVWNTPEDGGAEVSMEMVDGAVHLEFDGVAQNYWWYNGFDTTLEGTSLIKDAVYRLSLDAWGSDRPFCLYLNERGRDLNGDDNDYSNYIYILRPLETARKTYTYYFTMENPDDDMPTIGVLLSDSIGEVYLDNFSLTRITEVEDLIVDLSVNVAEEGYLASSNQILFYSIPVSPSTSYTLHWNDFSDGDETMGADIIVSAGYPGTDSFIFEQDDGYTTPVSFTTEATSTELQISVKSALGSLTRYGSFTLLLSQ